MKKMNLLVMSLVSAAALSFSSCSSNDDLGGGAGTQSQVDGFYMTLAIQTPTSNGTRTVGNKTESAKDVEQTVNKGTFFLVDQNGKVAFSRFVDNSTTADEDTKWDGATESKTGTKLINIKVDKVVAGTTYKVYFLAGDNQVPDKTNPTTHVFTATKKFANPFATDNNFAMFNQNDANVDGNGYTVVFTKDNKDKTNPAYVKYTKGDAVKEKAPIAIERITARIDAPTSDATNITATYTGDKEKLSEAVQEAMKDARDKVAGITLSRYAIVNLTNKANVMQTWSNSELSIPSDITMWQPTKSFGGEKLFADGGFTTVAATPHNYVFENTSTDPTKMYFEYKVTLDETKFKNKEGEVMPADYKDTDPYAGTFYRYNNIIFTSFAQIFNHYADVTDIFGKDVDAAAMKGKLDEIFAMEEGEAKEQALEKFRKDYDIEVFVKGLTYYRQNIVDKNLLTTGLPLIQRNTIYKLTVNNVFNIGAQVPNGEDEIDKKSLFYLNVTVSVNPWVLNTQDVSLGD